MKLMFLLLLTFAAFLPYARGTTISEDFSGPAVQQTSANHLIWNQALKQLQLPFSIVPTSPSNSGFSATTVINIGDGSDGPLSQSTLASLDMDHGAGLPTIYLDTGPLSSPRIYQFSQLNIPPGIVIRCRGPNPLDIRVQGNAEIRGQISVNGSDGNLGVGGAGGCSGFAGGNSGGASASGASGASNGNGAEQTAGLGGIFGVTDGGSGGGWVPGVNYPPRLQGGAGGGGGAGSVGSPGGAGGGGGGALRIQVGGDFLVHDTASVTADGGNGENGGAGGGGGGGSGGSIIIFVQGFFASPVQAASEASSGTATIHAYGGALGPSTTQAGGPGSDGLTWQVNYSEPGAVTGYDNIAVPLPVTIDEGIAIPAADLTSFESDYYDTGENSPVFSLPTLIDSNSGLISLSFSASHNPAGDPGTAFVDQTQIRQLNGKRFLKFRVQMKATAGTPPAVSKITVHSQENQFLFSASGCARVSASQTNSGGWWGALLFFIYLLSLPRTVTCLKAITLAPPPPKGE